MLPEKTERTILVKTRTKNISIGQSKISYLEADSNYCYIHLIDGIRIVVSKCLKQVQSSMEDSQFLKIHRKYVINIAHVYCIDISRSTIIMKSGAAVNISRSRKKEVTQWYTDYHTVMQEAG